MPSGHTLGSCATKARACARGKHWPHPSGMHSWHRTDSGHALQTHIESTHQGSPIWVAARQAAGSAKRQCADCRCDTNPSLDGACSRRLKKVPRSRARAKQAERMLKVHAWSAVPGAHDRRSCPHCGTQGLAEATDSAPRVGARERRRHEKWRRGGGGAQSVGAARQKLARQQACATRPTHSSPP